MAADDNTSECILMSKTNVDTFTAKPATTGRVVTLQHSSKVLRTNPLGDPATRPLNVYLPAAYDVSANKNRDFPVLYCLAGFTGSGPGQLNWKGFEENIIQRLNRLIANKDMPPVIVVFPDCFTSFGGTQYINSSAIGDYADYINFELVPLIDQQFRTKAEANHRGCFGKSSGGYGALALAMSYPKIWGGIASHSGDAYFDFVYRSDWPGVLTHLQRYAPTPSKRGPMLKQTVAGEDDGRVGKFLQHVWSRPPGGVDRISGNEMMALMLLGMAASYDPDPAAANGFYLPFDLQSGELLPLRWKKWLRHDPINQVSRYRQALKQLRVLYMDCGRQDQFHIHYGNRQLSRALNDAEIDHRYVEFDGTHSGIDHRLDTSLPLLAKRLR
jgi:enterochelin esterase-like enzyme